MFEQQWNLWDNPIKPARLTKKDIKEILTNSFGATETVTAQVGLHEVETKHICKNTTIIKKLSKISYPIQTQGSCIYAGVFFCNQCGKLIIDESSIELI